MTKKEKKKKRTITKRKKQNRRTYHSHHSRPSDTPQVPFPHDFHSLLGASALVNPSLLLTNPPLFISQLSFFTRQPFSSFHQLYLYPVWVTCFGFEYRLILSIFYVWFWVLFDTQYILCIVSRYCLILDELFVTFQGYHLEVFLVLVYKAPVILTRVFMNCHSLNLEKVDINRQSFNILGWTVSSSVRFKNSDQTYLAIKNYLVVAM